MSPLCETCQELIDPLNRLVDNSVFKGQVVVILRANNDACRAFLRFFPIHASVVCDETHKVSIDWGTHYNPFGLLYDAQGKLVRKGRILTYETFLALLGDLSVSPEALSNVHPSPASVPSLIDVGGGTGSKN